jgi:hypothetical protein
LCNTAFAEDDCEKQRGAVGKDVAIKPTGKDQNYAKKDCADKTCLRKSRINGLTFPGELDKIMKRMTSTFFSEELNQQILARPAIQKQRCVDKRR